jgi:hypothetical protein
VREEEERNTEVVARERRGGRALVTPDEDLAVREAQSGEASGVRGLARLEAVNHEAEARPGLDAWDESAHA